MRLHFHPFDLGLRHTFTISRGSVDVQPTLIVELEHDGLRGYGEATSNTYYDVTLASMTEHLDRLRPKIESLSWNDPAELWESVKNDLANDPFAQCALDQAAHDLWGKLQNKPVWQLWGLKLENLPRSNYTIGIDAIPVMQAKLREFADWPMFKIKLGTPQDVEIVQALRQITDRPFRVDANCAWTAEETLKRGETLAGLNVEFIEQPLPREAWGEMQRVFEHSRLPLMADESCQREEDVDRCAGLFHGINIKLVKCGGLTPARRMIARARQLGLKTMVGCMTESTVGISAIAQLLPLLDYVDMDGAALLAADIASGVQVVRGVAEFPPVAGCGVELFH